MCLAYAIHLRVVYRCMHVYILRDRIPKAGRGTALAQTGEPYIYIYICRYRYRYIDMYKCTCVCVCMFVYIYIYI